MKTYTGAALRNVVFVGHGQAGKTQLVSHLLFCAGATKALGLVDKGTTLTDFDEDSVERKMSLQLSAAHAEYADCKLNFLDTPGFNMLLHDAELAMEPAEMACVVVHGVRPVEAVTSRVWGFAKEAGLPRLLVASRMDQERAEAGHVVQALQQSFGRQVLPLQLTLGAGASLRGIVDLVAMKAYTYEAAGRGRGKEIPIPVEAQDAARAGHQLIVELVAEGKDELLEEFVAKGTLAEARLIPALHEAIAEDRIFPVLFTSGLSGVGVDRLLEFFVTYGVVADAPLHPANPEEAEVQHWEHPVGTDREPVALYVYKTANDPYLGRISYFRVVSGVLKNDAALHNFNRNVDETFAHLSIMQGKTPEAVPELHAGDLGAVAKLKDTHTGDSLGVKGRQVHFGRPKLPEPVISFAVEPKTRADEDRLSGAIHKLLEEDPMLRFSRDAQTKEFLLSGAGQQHVELVVTRLKRRYNTDVKISMPKVPYRETVTGSADAHGRHKKQTGGHGQFGDCKIKLEPMARGAGIEFVNDIFGGSIPKNFVPAVEKGVREACERGNLAGFPVVDFKVVLYDGSYHDVDSSELAFKLAGRLAFRKAMTEAHPALLEPIMHMEIATPDELAGAVMGDMNGRRGKILGLDNRGGETVIKAEAPMSEVLSYNTVLNGLTHAAGHFTMEVTRYDLVPPALAQKIIESQKHQLPQDEE